MTAIVSRPAAGATPVPARAKGGPRRSPAPADPGGARHPAPPAAGDARNGAPRPAGGAPERSEGDALALKAAADDEYVGPCSLTKSQLLTVMETAAGNLDTINQLLMQAQAEQDEGSAWLFVNAAQALTRHCGGMVDGAAGGSILGGHDRWNFGPNFATPGKDAAA